MERKIDTFSTLEDRVDGLRDCEIGFLLSVFGVYLSYGVWRLVGRLLVVWGSCCPAFVISFVVFGRLHGSWGVSKIGKMRVLFI